MSSTVQDPPAVQGKSREDQNAARLAEWRKKREKVAEASKQERQRLAEAQRQERMRQFEKDKEERVRAKAEARAQEDATRRVERLTSARAKLADRGDLDVARERIAVHRRSRMRAFLLRIGVMVGLPVALVAVYVFSIATPLFEAEARFVVTGGAIAETALSEQRALVRADQSAPAFMVRDMILSREMLATLNEKNDFAGHMAPGKVDAFMAMQAVPLLGLETIDQFKRHVRVGVNPSEGSVVLRVRARDGATAEGVATTILATVQGKMTAVRTAAGVESQRPPIVTYLSPVAAEMAAFPRPVPSLLLTVLVSLGVYGIGSILIASLRRHGAR